MFDFKGLQQNYRKHAFPVVLRNAGFCVVLATKLHKDVGLIPRVLIFHKESSMADHCYNLISFFGNDKVLKQVHAWRKKIAKFKPTKEDPYCMRAINEVFYPGQDRTEIDYGSKWVHLDDDSTGADEDQLGLQSAWSSPDLLLEHMACLLYKLDPHVIIENTFNIQDGSIGFRYVTPISDTETYTQEGDYQVSYEDYEEPEEAEDAAYEEYKIDRLEYLTDMISDIPETFNVIKAFIPDLVQDWDKLKREIDDNATEDRNYVEGSSGLERFLKLKGH